jgi:gamma-glutamylputrescine oxidase
VSSYWLDDPAEQLEAPRADGPVDVAIVGGGVTGCSCAVTLARGGKRVRVHDARAIAAGASGRNGGFALRGGALQYHHARRQLGAESAQALWRLTEAYLDRMGELAGDTLRRTGSLRLAADEDERNGLRAEYEALREDDFSAEWIDELVPPLDRLYRGAIRHPTDGALHPARWVRRLAATAAEAGAQLAEHHRVESLDDLEAEHVVLATDGYTQGLVPELDRVITPTRGQVIATEPLERRLFDCPHYARHGFDYWQQTDDDRLILGGRRDVRLQDEETGNETITEPIQDALERFAAELVGEPPRISARWAGIFGTTSDRLPLAGRVPGHDGVWVAAGYSGHGNVLGFACGDLVAGAILGLPPPELALFDPSRLL